MYREHNYYEFFFSLNNFDKNKINFFTNFPQINVIIKGNSITLVKNLIKEMNQEIEFAKESSKRSSIPPNKPELMNYLPKQYPSSQNKSLLIEEVFVDSLKVPFWLCFPGNAKINIYIKNLDDILELIKNKTYSKILIKILQHMNRIRISLDSFSILDVRNFYSC